MGMYNDYYKKYYANMGQQKASNAYVPKGYNGNGESRNKGSVVFPIFLNVFGKGYTNIFIGQCVITLMLFGGLILYRAYPTTDLGKAYALGLDYMGKGINIEEFSKEEVASVFSEVKSVFNFNEKKEGFISENYINPVAADSGSSFQVEDNRLLIKTAAGTDIRASYEGKVKAVKDGTVTINYGEGIEMIYSGMDEINAVEGMTLNANEVIGKAKAGSEGDVSIEILYMGDKLNPSSCFNLNETL